MYTGRISHTAWRPAWVVGEVRAVADWGATGSRVAVVHVDPETISATLKRYESAKQPQRM